MNTTTAAAPAQGPAPTKPAANAPALGADDETTLYGSLPAGFWGEDDAEVPPLDEPPLAEPRRHAKSSTEPAVVSESSRPGPGGATTDRRTVADEPAQDEPPTTAKGGAGTSLAELQELFPGRIIEVMRNPEPTATDAAGDEAVPVDAEGDLDAEGYDDPDQAQLSFGPRE